MIVTNMKRFVIVGLVLLSGCAGQPASMKSVDLSSCLRRMTSVCEFADSPVGHACLISTYDKTGGNNDGAFWDLTGGPDENGECLIADLKGPGCVTRIWQTSVPADEWLFYFDGEKSPRIQVSDKELFGSSELFPEPICGTASEGRYCYMPLPFERSLQIVVKAPRLRRNSKSYCHVNWISYPRETHVKSFPKQLNDETKELVRKVSERWTKNDDVIGRCEVLCGEPIHMKLPGRSEKTWLRHMNSGVLKSFSIEFKDLDHLGILERMRLLRSTIVRIYWNGEQFPSVDVPLGDFFCNALYHRSFSSMPLAYINGKYVCCWPMPFEGSVLAKIRNDSDKAISLSVSYDVSALPNKTPSHYFHARYDSSLSRGVPHTVLQTSGKGHYAGCYLNAIGTDGTWTILEGDECIRVDGNPATAMYGTGLEDYFNGAWYYSGLFDLPLHGLVEKAPIRTAQYRFHLLDAVKFDRSIKVDFEFGHADKAKGYMSSVAYWYQDEPKAVSSGIPPLMKRFPPSDPLYHAGFMSHLFELERIEHYEEARDRCLAYAEQFSDSPYKDMFALRAVAYKELTAGFEQVEDDYATVATRTDADNVSSQAQDLLWFHEDEKNALLACHANAEFKLYLDGRQLLSGSDPVRLQVARVSLEKGLHEMCAEITAVRPDPWFSVFLRTQDKNIVTDSSWECTRNRPPNWPQGRIDSGVNASRSWRVLRILPRIGSWYFQPNAYVNMQSGWQLMRPWSKWGRKGKETAYVRKTFVVER